MGAAAGRAPLGRRIKPQEQPAEAGQGWGRGSKAHMEAGRGPPAQNLGVRPRAGRALGRERIPIHRRCPTERTGHAWAAYCHLLENKM